MPDEKKPEEDEVTEEQLEGVAGGVTAPQDLNLTKQVDKASPPIMDKVVEGAIYGSAELDVRTAGDEDD